MKIIAIGDTHGRDNWKKIVEKEIDADKIIFIGDYFDSFDLDQKTQIDNFVDILELKKELPDTVELLIGNHDFHYTDTGETYSGYQRFNSEIQKVLIPAIKQEVLKICHKEGNILFTHAGLSKNFLEYLKIDFNKLNNLDVVLNEFYYYKPTLFNFRGNNDYGDDITQGPLWIRPKSLQKDGLDGFIQVVGHTFGKLHCLNNKYWFIDSVAYNQYLNIEDNQFIIETYE